MLRALLPAIGLLVVTLPISSGEKKVGFEVYAKPYFVKNKAPITGNPAYVVVQDKKAFDEIFGVAFVMGAKPKLVDEKLFEKNLIIVVVKAGNAVTTYKVEEAAADKKKLVLKYTTTDKGPTSAAFRSPLIVSVPRSDFTEVIFIENGKEAAKHEVKK